MKIFEKTFSIFNTIMYLKGYNINKHSKSIEKLKNKTLNECLDWLETKKWKITKFHYSNNNFYKQKTSKKEETE